MNEFSVDKQKAEQLDRLFKHLKHPDGPKKFKADPKTAVQGLDPKLVDVFSKLDEKELRAISDLNEKLVAAGFGVSPGMTVAMV